MLDLTCSPFNWALAQEPRVHLLCLPGKLFLEAREEGSTCQKCSVCSAQMGSEADALIARPQAWWNQHAGPRSLQRPRVGHARTVHLCMHMNVYHEHFCKYHVLD